MQPQLKFERWALIMAVAEPAARLVLVRLSAPTGSLLPCCRTRGRHSAHRARAGLLPLDEYSRRSATELSSSASAPQRPFHRPQDVVAEAL